MSGLKNKPHCIKMRSFLPNLLKFTIPGIRLLLQSLMRNCWTDLLNLFYINGPFLELLETSKNVTIFTFGLIKLV